MTPERTRRRDYPGWRMVWVLAGTETIAYAALFYCFAVMVVPMREALDATTGQLSAALSLAIAVNGAAALLVGRWLDRHGARWLMSGGSLLGAVSVVGWSQAQSLPQLYLAFVVLFGAGFGVMTIARAALLGSYVPEGVYGSVAGGQSLAANAGRVIAPAAAGALITGAGYPTALALVAVCSLGTAVLLLAAERAHLARGVVPAAA